MTIENESDYKILRLSTGEDIIGHCVFDDEEEYVLVGNPMKVMLQRVPEMRQTVLIMMPWLPLELIEDDLVTINYGDIITSVNPKESFVEYYIGTVDKYQKVLEKESNLESYSLDDFGSDDEDEEQEFDSMMDELLEEAQQDKKNQLLH